jgi:hypothetical protein
MRHGQAQLVLRPLQGGSFTQVRLTATVPTSPPAVLMRRGVAALAFWSGWPVELVLCVGLEAGAWCDVWCDALKDVAEDHLDLRFRLPRRDDEGGAGERR